MTLFRALTAVAAVAIVNLPFARAESAADVPAAAAVIALGRAPDQSTAATPGETLSAVVANAKQRLSTDTRLAAAVAQKAFVDAFGRVPAAGELQGGGALTYTEWMQRHVKTLSEQPEKYEAAIRAAYPIIIHRDVYPEEIAYWKKHGVVPYYLLLAAIENWARRNQPGLMVTAGAPTISINSSYLTTVRVAPADVAEVRKLIGPTPAADSKSQTDQGAVLAPGGDGIETDGGMYFLAAGR